MSEPNTAGKSTGHADLDAMRKILTEIIGAQISKRTFTASEIFEDETAERAAGEICERVFNSELDSLRMILFIYARVLKERFLSESHKEATSRNRFFKYTISLTWRKDSLDFNRIYLTEPEKSGRLDGLVWCIRIPIKQHGGKMIGYRYERIINHHPERPYSRNSFRGAETWEKDLIIKYEKKFAVIRKMLSSIGNIKRSGYFLGAEVEKLFSAVDLNEDYEGDFDYTEEDMDDLG